MSFTDSEKDVAAGEDNRRTGFVLTGIIMHNKKRMVTYIVLVVITMALIFVHSALPAQISKMESSLISDGLSKLLHLDASTASFIVRKGAHFFEYLLLGIFSAIAAREIYFYRNGTTSLKGVKGWFSIWLLAWAVGAVYALSDELHQHFVSGRSCEIRDILIDAGGALLGVLLIMMIQFIKRRMRG